jgi:endosialidase-like protein
MSFRKQIRLVAISIAMLAFAQIAYSQTAGEGKVANMSVGSTGVRWDVTAPSAGGAVTITFPDGRQFKKVFRGGSAEIDLTDKQIDGMPDGVYNYEVRLTPVLTGAQKEAMAKARGNDDDAEADRAGRKRPVLPQLTQSGTFAVANGMLIGPGAIEGQRVGSNANSPQLKAPTTAPARVSENTMARLRNHRFSLTMRPDVVNADDFIIQGSLCVGLDCVNNESFGFDTIRLKENNTRIKFDDTSVSAGFPNNDWQLTANDSASGGANKFSIEDITGSKVPFTITAGAPTNSMFVASSGKVGLGNSSPGLNIHITASDTPAIRQEQTNAGGFTAQTWDIGANEANWFVRDLTGGSRLPLRIRPGAPTSSIDISATGNVGIGTASPSNKLHILGAGTAVVVDAGNGLDFFGLQTLTSTTGITGRVTGVSLGNSSAWFGVQTNSDNNPNGGFYVKGTGGSSPVLIASTNGRVGINTTSPDQSLSVNGDASKVGGGSWQTFSDERLKNIKGQYRSGLSAVMRLQPIRYEYKAGNALGLQSNGEHIGFGAQSLEKVIPEAISRNSQGYLMVNNDPILWTMLNAIKEQQKEIADLKAQVRKLRSGRTAHRNRK